MATLVSAATPLARRGAVEREFHACFALALRKGFAAQDRDDGGVSASLVADAFTADKAFRLLAAGGAQLSGPDRDVEWARILGEELPALRLLNDDIDLPRLARDTARLLGLEIERAAQQQGSALFQPLILSRNAPAPQASAVATWTAGLSNLWDLPLAPEPIGRDEIKEVESVLSEHPIAVVSGGAGLGKSTLAWMIARRRADADDAPSIWWMNGSSRESLSASCDALLRALGVVPEDDVLLQVRRELSRHQDWFLVLDDVNDGDLIGAVVPAGVRPGAVIATTRDGALRSPGRLVSLGATDQETMGRIARSLLPADTPVDQIDDIVGSCAGHPLVLATICRFVAATGASATELGELLRTEPSVVLSEELGPHYPVSFAEVVARMLKDVVGEASMQVLLAAAVASGQQVPRSLLESALPFAPAEIRAGLRHGSMLGLIEISGSAVSCHAVVSDMIVVMSPDAAAVATLLLESIKRSATELSDTPLHELAAIANTVSARTEHDVEGVASVHLALAQAFAAGGMAISAEEQIATVKARMPEEISVDVAGHVLIAEARVLLTGGDYTKAIAVAEQGVALGESAQLAGLRAACLIVLAWCYENLGDRPTALKSAEAAAELVPDDPDAQALRLRFAIPDQPTPEHIDEYLALARNAALGAPGRALYFGLASRAATRLGRNADAIAYARRALELDRAQGRTRTVIVARDLNDLGMALVDADELEEAEDVLRESLEIYESEDPGHPMGVAPRIHLGRLLAQKLRKSEHLDQDVFDQAIQVLEPAVRVQRLNAPDSPDHAAALVALADVLLFQDPARAGELLNQALQIDRAVYPDDHYEVGLDVLKLMDYYAFAEQPEHVLRVFRIVGSAVPEWERTYPNVAAQLLCLQADALRTIGVLGGLPRIVQRLKGLAADPRLPDWLRAYVESVVQESEASHHS